MNAPLTSAPKIECSPEEWEARVDLACAYRAVSAMGWHNSIIYNHISTRVPGTQSHFLINPFGLLYNEITASNLLKVDIDGNKLTPSQYPVLMAGFVVHRSILHDKIAYYDVQGVTNDTEESDQIAAALGNKNVAILRNHGLLTCGPTMGHAFHLMRRIESACETQVMAQAGGAELIFPPMDVIRKTATQTTQIVKKDNIDTSDGPALLWAAVRRWMAQIDPGYMD